MKVTHPAAWIENTLTWLVEVGLGHQDEGLCGQQHLCRPWSYALRPGLKKSLTWLVEVGLRH